ncbi:uncharacterized protein EI90DRAFT_3073362 [Cantharellus anzutake]|uniref:uncharacterized protein n=1 Tax=Cantharellus anzutake TaxID=1750568 RepID=UPI00190511D5|nr:uncharacterized protein EI90DRAFT_3073362 [Cantharellus anzutake]KAF8325207.1 hypothetical protein EI90DRAFT_3073362 [Cantharellus anzutake]
MTGLRIIPRRQYKKARFILFHFWRLAPLKFSDCAYPRSHHRNFIGSEVFGSYRRYRQDPLPHGINFEVDYVPPSVVEFSYGTYGIPSARPGKLHELKCFCHAFGPQYKTHTPSMTGAPAPPPPMATVLINLILSHNVYGASIPPHNITDFSLHGSHTCNDLQNCRTVWSLIYSCAFTIFACVCTGMHPDLSARHHSTWSFKLPRVGLMMGSLLSPGVILMDGWMDFCNAWIMSKKCNDLYMSQGWTFTHSYFVVMRGFFDSSEGAAVIPDRNVDALSVFEKYPGIIQKIGDQRRVVITKEQILDRCRGDLFAEFAIILQLLWFIAQYVGRWVGDLHRSQLEAMTLGYAAFNALVYLLWWHKPVNVRFLAIHVAKEPRPNFSTSGMDVVQPRPGTGTDIHSALAKIMELDPSWMFIATGIIFGGIHCFAWSSPFPTLAEMQLWRTSALVIAAFPVLCVLCERLDNPNIAKNCIMVITAVYVTARIILLVVSFTSLRSPPPDLYQIPSWSTFLPHFG